MREGCLVYRGLDARGQPIYQQKRVDLFLGLDFALLAPKHQITHAAIVSGDSDLVPDFEAQQEAIQRVAYPRPHRELCQRIKEARR